MDYDFIKFPFVDTLEESTLPSAAHSGFVVSDVKFGGAVDDEELNILDKDVLEFLTGSNQKSEKENTIKDKKKSKYIDHLFEDKKNSEKKDKASELQFIDNLLESRVDEVVKSTSRSTRSENISFEKLYLDEPTNNV